MNANPLSALAPLELPTAEQHPFDFRAAEHDDVDLIQEYLTLKALVAQCTERMDEIKPRLIDLVTDQPRDNKGRHLATAFGFSFRVYYRSYYDYSEEVQALERELKALKKLEEAQDLATVKKQSAILQITTS